MPLTEQQIEELFKFTKKKLVHYYDLQVELVDHLASSIEEELKENPSLSFELALQKVYNRFGLFGFAKVVQEREAALLRNNRRIWWHAIKSYFTIPKLFISLTVFFGALVFSHYFSPEARGVLVFSSWCFLTFYQVRQTIKAQKVSVKKLLLTQYTGPFSFTGFIFPYWFLVIDSGPIHHSISFACFMTFLFIVELAIIEVNKKIRRNAEKLYPEAFITS